MSGEPDFTLLSCLPIHPICSRIFLIFIISLRVVLKKSPDLLRGYIINHFFECDYLRWAIKVFLVCLLSLYEHIFETLLFVFFVTCLFYYTCYFMQACGMKLLRTRDNPDYKVMFWYNNKLNHVKLVITFSRMLQASIYLHMHKLTCIYIILFTHVCNLLSLLNTYMDPCCTYRVFCWFVIFIKTCTFMICWFMIMNITYWFSCMASYDGLYTCIQLFLCYSWYLYCHA